MSLHVILGPPGAGKAGRSVDVLRAAAATGVDTFLCVPGVVDRSRFLRELAASDGGVLLGVEVGTFEQLVARVAGSPAVRRTDRAMERIVVRDALRGEPAFAAAARWSGFVDTARRHVDALRRARVWGGDELQRVESELPGGEVADWRALEERVAALLGERRLRDDAWFQRRAAAGLRAGRPGVGAVVVYGFEALAPIRVELLERLASHVPVTVALAWRPGRRVHERAAELRDRWYSRGAFVEELDAVPALEPTLDWLGSELFEDSPSAPPVRPPRITTPAPVAFVDCCGSLQEAEEVAREVAMLASRGFDWDDIVVASADAAADGHLVLAALRRACIPARLQAHRHAVDVPAGRALHELLDAAVERDALRLVAALRAPVFGMDAAAMDAVELAARAARRRPGDPMRLGQLSRALPAEVVALLRLGPGDGGAVAAVRSLLGMLLPEDLGELDLLRGVAASVEGLVVAAGGAAHLSLRDVCDAVRDFPLIVPDRSDSGAVVVASLEDLRSVAFDAVVLRGMHLVGFRARVDDEADAPAFSRDLLHVAVTRARRTLRVVRQAAGSDGGHLAPSPAWSELRRLQPDAPLRTRRLGEVLVAPDAVRTTAEVGPSVALATGSGLVVDGVPDATAKALRATRREPRPDRLTSQLAREFAGLEHVSVTDVERYATCSAKWFIERRLRTTDPDEDRTRLLEGAFAHALLQELVPAARLGAEEPDETRARAVERVPALAGELDRGGLLDAARVERITEHVLALVESEAEWDTPDAIDVERSFGSEAPDSIGPGYVVDGVEVVGRIDRIDRHAGHVVLHDYKYGSTDRPVGRLLEDRNLQLLVYWLAMERPGSTFEPIGAMYRAVTNGGSTSGVYSAPLRDLGIVGARTRAGVLDEGQRRELLDATADLVAESIAGMRTGRVAPLPSRSMCPEHCQLQAICRVGEPVPA